MGYRNNADMHSNRKASIGEPGGQDETRWWPPIVAARFLFPIHELVPLIFAIPGPLRSSLMTTLDLIHKIFRRPHALNEVPSTFVGDLLNLLEILVTVP